MNKGRHAKHSLSRKPGLLLASLLLIFTITTAGTLAFLIDETDVVKNTFTAGEVPNEVVEQIADGVKNNVAIVNTGTVDAYVRAAVIATWVDETGNVAPASPEAISDYEITWSGLSNGWIKGADGFYYYTQPVAPNNGATSVLFTGCKPVADKAPSGYTLSVEILGQTIQADGKTEAGTPVVVEVWGTNANGSVESVADDGTLTITE